MQKTRRICLLDDTHQVLGVLEYLTIQDVPQPLVHDVVLLIGRVEGRLLDEEGSLQGAVV